MNIYRESGKWYFAGMDNNRVVWYGPYPEPPRIGAGAAFDFADKTCHMPHYNIRFTRASFIVSREWNKRTKMLTEIIYRLY